MTFPDPRPALARGIDRLSERWVLLLQIGVSVFAAWLVASEVLGHVNPFFAPVTAILCLGLTYGQDPVLRAVGRYRAARGRVARGELSNSPAVVVGHPNPCTVEFRPVLASLSAGARGPRATPPAAGKPSG